MAGEAQTVEELQAANKKLQDDQAEKDRKIQDLEAESATLKKRAESTQTPQQPVQPQGAMSDEQIEAETTRIETLRATDPAKAAKETASLMKKIAISSANAAASSVASNITPAIEQNQFIEKIKTENADLLAISPAMEDILGAEARQAMEALPMAQRNQAQFQKVLKDVVAKKRESLKDLLKKTEEQKPEVPKGAQAESGGAAPGVGGIIIKKSDTEDRTSPSGRAALAASKGL